MDRFLRRATPVLLLCFAAMAWFEQSLPAGVRELFGDLGLLRFVVGALCLYIMLLILERQNMEERFTQVLKAFRQFLEARSGEGAARAESGQNQKERLQALRILVAALDSPEADIRQTAAENLERLCGKNFGTDSAAWQRWLAEQAESAGGAGGEGTEKTGAERAADQ